ncbi:MAG: CHAD domain-containing protein [Planctomycetaceae bacterium]
MKATLPDKWVEAAANDRLGDVAIRTLKGRLGAVLQCLPAAANEAEEDIEHIHQLRVWTRRATAALVLYQDLIPSRRFSWMEKQLKRIRRAANEARDCDVLLEWLNGFRSQPGVKRLRKAVRAQRAEAQQAVMRVSKRLEHDRRLSRRIDKLTRSVRAFGEGPTAATSRGFENWAREQLTPLVEQFFAAIPADKTDEAALHRFRISGKKLRYSLELLSGALPERSRSELYPIIEAMQDRLGEINDLATAKIWLQQNRVGSKPKHEAARQRLLATAQARSDEIRTAFWAWCTPQMLEALRSGFETLLCDSIEPAQAHRGLDKENRSAGADV